MGLPGEPICFGCYAHNMSRKTKEFMNLYDRCCKNVGGSGRESYELAEESWIELHETRRYSGYRSFRAARSSYMSRSKGKKRAGS